MQLKGAWNAVPPHEQHVLALTAKISELERGRKPPCDCGDHNRQQTPSKRFKGEQAWKAIAPKNGEVHAKMVGKITFDWCPHHSFWTVHKASKCTLAMTITAGSEDTIKLGSKTPQTKIAPKPTLSWAQATAAVISNNNDNTNEQLDV
jgi:hypothetical protein